jgi:hypothetical protein
MPLNPTVRQMLTTLFLLLAMIVSGASATAQTPIPDASWDPNALHIIKPDLREAVAAELPSGLTVYEIDVTFPDDPASRILSGEMTVTYTNTTGDPLTDLPFRLYANSAAEGEAAVTLDSVTVDGEGVEPVLSERSSVALLPLSDPLQPDASTSIEVAFTTTVPVDEPAHYGIFNYASATDTWSLAHWYPVVAGRDPEGGWMLEPTSRNGDPIYTETGMYTVRVTAPEDLQLITSGVEIASEPAGDGIVTSTWSAAPSRDFVMLADDDIQSVTDVIDGTTVTSWFHDGRGPAGEATLLWTAQSLELFNELLGEYPFVHLQAVEAAMFNAAGVEYPQLFTISEGYYDTAPDLNEHGYFEFTVAHEVVHQWFYGIVGNNQYDSAFIDEGLTNYLSSRVYFSELYGDEVGRDVFGRNVARPFRYMVEGNTDVIVDTPTDAFPSERDYVNAAYVKAPMGFGAIHEEIGDEAFFGGLQAYVAEFRFEVATPADMLAAFEEAAEIEVQPIWSHWFAGRNGSLDIRD